jgi:SecD/SecF fusion protein
MVGIVSGAWSSITIAGPLWYDLSAWAEKRRAAKKEAEKAAKKAVKAAKAAK